MCDKAHCWELGLQTERHEVLCYRTISTGGDDKETEVHMKNEGREGKW